MRKTFEVTFADGNKRLLEADNIVDVLYHLVGEEGYVSTDIIKIEERVDK